MNIDKRLDLLKQIKEVDAPAFLYTRISQQIHNIEYNKAPSKWKWGFAVASLAVLILNIGILFNSINETTENTPGIETVIKSMDITSINNIYNE